MVKVSNMRDRTRQFRYESSSVSCRLGVLSVTGRSTQLDQRVFSNIASPVSRVRNGTADMGIGHFQEDVQGNEELVAEVLGTAAQSIENAVNLKLVGYFTYPAGIGQIARWTLRTLEEADIHPAIDRVFEPSDSYEYLSNLLK